MWRGMRGFYRAVAAARHVRPAAESAPELAWKDRLALCVDTLSARE
jgi:hypothetical protein